MSSILHNNLTFMITLCKLCVVRARMCSTNQAHPHFKRGYGAKIRRIFSLREDMRDELGTSSVQVRMRSTSEAYHQYDEDLQYKQGRSSCFGT